MQLERERHGAGRPRLCIGDPAVHPRVIADPGNRSLLNHGVSFPLSLDGGPRPPGGYFRAAAIWARASSKEAALKMGMEEENIRLMG